MSEVRIAIAAQHFDTFHEMAGVGLRPNVIVGRGSAKTWPAGAGIELVVGFKQFGAAAHAAIHPGIVVVPVFAAKGPLCSLLPRHCEFIGRKLALPFGVAFFNLAHTSIIPARSNGKVMVNWSPAAFADVSWIFTS